MTIEDYSSRSLAAIRKEIDELKETLARGVAVDEYRRFVGIVEGLRIAEEVLCATLKKMSIEDDQD